MRILDMKKIMALVLAVVLVGASGIYAKDRVDTRQTKQMQRIKQGLQSGKLNRHETKKLVKQQKRINKVEKRAEADGKVTIKEKARLEKMQNKASKNIVVKKHNIREVKNYKNKRVQKYVMSRSEQQIQRIKQGIASGQLTKREADKLIRKQLKIQKIKRIMIRDGKLLPKEMAKLDKLQNIESKKIMRNKHDKQKRWWQFKR